MCFCDHDAVEHKKRSNMVTGILFVIGGVMIKTNKGELQHPLY